MTSADLCSVRSALFGRGFRTLEALPAVTYSLSVLLFSSFFYLRKKKGKSNGESAEITAYRESDRTDRTSGSSRAVSLASRGFDCSEAVSEHDRTRSEHFPDNPTTLGGNRPLTTHQTGVNP